MAAANHAAEFQARRAETWRHSRVWLVVTMVGFAGGFAANQLITTSFVVGLAFVAIVMLGILKLVLTVQAHYRCPKCEQVVMDGLGVPLSPKACPHCHAELR